MCSSHILNPHPHSLPTLSLWVVLEHQLWGPGFMHRTCTGHVSHMIMYTFQCYSLKSSHPHLLPLSSKVCSLHLCIFCCLTYRVIVAIFLNYICVYIYIYMFRTSTHVKISYYSSKSRMIPNSFALRTNLKSFVLNSSVNQIYNHLTPPT